MIPVVGCRDAWRNGVLDPILAGVDTADNDECTRRGQQILNN